MAASTPSPTDAFNMCDGPQQNDEQIDLLGRPVQKLVKLIKELETLGVETKNLPLPKIVVVGDQSAGKSSLIEGLSGIKVPRSDGTCTRCPLQITLYPSEDDPTWSATVSLQQKFTYRENEIEGRYGKWREDHTPTTTVFATVNNKDELERVISRAQRATLNPGDDPFTYLNSTSVDDMPLKVEFSPNKVILDITAPGQPSLSFIDLPGVIRQMTTARDKWLVGLVENFVADHIKQDNSLILLARSMESDFANSSAAALIDQCEGALARTVGCLTKPDRWPPGTKTKIIRDVLEGGAFEVGHGYFVAKQPNQLELNDNISADNSRRSEVEFFAQAPWSTDLHNFHDRFGTFKLRDALSIKLTKQILITLPRITRTVDARLQEIELELAGYPDPPENALGKILEALTEFRLTVEKHVQGAHPYNELRNSLRGFDKQFQTDLEKLRPRLSTKTPIEVLSLVSDDEETPNATPCPQSHKSQKRPSDFDTPTPAKRFKQDVTSASQGRAGSRVSAPDNKKKDLQEIRNILADLSTSEVPNEVDPLAIDHLRKGTLVGWEQPTMEFINSVKQEIQDTLDRLLENACSQWLNTDFFSEAKQILRSFVSQTIADQVNHAKRALALEHRKPRTIDIEGFDYHYEKELKVLQGARTTQRMIEKLEAADRAAGRDLLAGKRERNKKALTDLKARAELCVDSYDQEVKVMARVRGYHRVALLRYVDHVTQGIYVEVLHDLQDLLPQQLKTGLEVETREAHERSKELLAEDRQREVHRKNLQKQKANFIKAQQKIAHIEQSGDNV